LKTFLSPKEILQIEERPTENLEAYNYYLIGNDYYWRSLEKQNFEIAIKMYAKAIDKAFKIDQDLPQAHLALGYYYYWGFLDYKKALEEVKIAENILKNNSECIYTEAVIYRPAGGCS